MQIGSNRVLQCLPYVAGDILIDNSLGQYNQPAVMTKRLLEIFEQGQVESTPDVIFEARELIALGPEAWMKEYDYGDMEDFEACEAGLINEIIDSVLSRMLPHGLMLPHNWDDGIDCLYVRESN